MRSHRRALFAYSLGVIALIIALWYGRTRTAPDLAVPIAEIFPQATAFRFERGVFHVYDDRESLLGWAGSGSESGYGGPMLLVVGIDTLGRVAGSRVVEQRETPIFWRMVKARDFLTSFVGDHFDQINYDYGAVVGLTGATISATAIAASVRSAVADLASEAFDVTVPVPARPFEFGLLEITVLLLFIVGAVTQRARGPVRRRVRWACQITGLLVLGFWRDSPITLAKITALLSGYFPDPRTQVALYLLIAGFVLTSFHCSRNLYCLYACPFGTAQRCVGVIGGKGLKLPIWFVRWMERIRNVAVFAAMFMAFLTLKPVLASYEPFAVLFSLNGTTLQWLLLFIVLVMSLGISTPWCNLFCPMRTIELLFQNLRRTLRGPRTASANE